jgi:hypothetical protein
LPRFVSHCQARILPPRPAGAAAAATGSADDSRGVPGAARLLAVPPPLAGDALPGASFKLVAALQWAHRGEEPVLIRIETRAGHGGGKPTDKQIEEAADEWAFLVDNLGMELPAAY